jgi:putative exosortase-associated protein (TIGR04073 family)
MTQADMQQQGYSENSDYSPVSNADAPLQQASYGEKIGNKALIGFANLTTGILEIPKNMINTINESNFFYGVGGGFIKGTVNTLGRMGCGIADIITLPIPTKPVAYPLFIWDDFDADTTYGEVLRLNKSQRTIPPVTLAPVAPPVPVAVATPPKAAEVDVSNQYPQETSRKLDALFRQEMQK